MFIQRLQQRLFTRGCQVLHVQPQQSARGNTLQTMCVILEEWSVTAAAGVFLFHSMEEWNDTSTECWELVSQVFGVRCTISSLHIALDLRVKHLGLINISYTASLL